MKSQTSGVAWRILVGTYDVLKEPGFSVFRFRSLSTLMTKAAGSSAVGTYLSESKVLYSTIL
jgi:hypothetical protein